MTSQHKTCAKCGESKVLEEFYREKRSKGGRRARCKPCMNEYTRRYYKGNRDKVAEQKRRYREENRDKILDRKRRYREKNRDKTADRDRSYYEENKETIDSIERKRSSELQELSQSLAAVKPGTPWIPGEDALLLADNGMTVYQKAIELGRSYGSCRNRMGRLRAAKSA